MVAEVIDSFDVKGRVAIEYGANGVVVIVRSSSPIVPPESNAVLLLVRPDGWMTRAQSAEVKASDERSFGVFLPSLTKVDVPIGSSVRWGAGFWPEPNDLSVGVARQSLVAV